MPDVSIFKNVLDIHNPDYIDIELYLEKIRDGEWEDEITKLRTLPEDQKKDFKKTLPTVSMSGRFTERRDDSIIEHSGILAIDLDHVENLNTVKNTLSKDRYVYSVFMSASGTGLRVLFKVDFNKHREAFKGIRNYLYESYNIINVDPNGINVSKPYIVSFDPYIFIQFEECLKFKKYVKELPVKNMQNFVHTSGDFEEIVKQIVARRINICDHYDDYLKVGFAISSQYGEDGRWAFHEIARISEKYNQKTADEQYTYCIKARGAEKVNISSFYYMAKNNGVSIYSKQTQTIVRTTKNGRRAGLSKEKIIDNLAKFHNIQGADTVVEKVFASDTEAANEEEESVLYQLEMFISSNYSLRMNEVTGYLEQNGNVLSPADLNTVFIAAKKLMPKLDYQLLIRLLKSDFIETYNPFFEFLGSDGIPVILPAIPISNGDKFNSPLIDQLAKTIVNDNPSFTAFFLRKWMVSIISAMHKVHSPLLLALLGSQNTGKTEFFRRLLPKELSHYYAESKLDKEKDDELLMCENILVMDDELGGKSKQDNIKMNNITSKQWFSLRRPYGDHNEKILRLAVLCGTSNYFTILSDPTGNRRIIPIEVQDIDKELYNLIDKKQLIMEAYDLYKGGFDWRITKDDIPFLNKDQDKYETVVVERELLLKYFCPGFDLHLSTSEIKVEIEHVTGQKLSIPVLGRELDRMGFVRKTVREGKSTLKKWGVRRLTVSKEDLPF